MFLLSALTLFFRISIWKSMSEWTIPSTIRMFLKKWKLVKKCPTYVRVKNSKKWPFLCNKIMKSSHFTSEMSLTIQTKFLWVNVTIWHWVSWNIPKIKDFRGYHPSFGTYFNFGIFGCFYWAPWAYFFLMSWVWLYIPSKCE